MYRQVHPKQFATFDFVDLDPENDSGSNSPPVPTYAAMELLPPTSGFAPKLGELVIVDTPTTISAANANRKSLSFI